MKEDVRSVPDGLSPFGSSQQAVSPVPASIPSAEALVNLMVDWASVPSTYFQRRYPFFNEMLARVMKEFDFRPTETQAATTFVFVELAEALDAQAIDARRAETQSGSVADESAVAKPCAQGDAA